MDVEAIQVGLATAAKTVSGLNAQPSLPDAINPPLFAVTEFEHDYNQTFAGGSFGMVETLFTCGLFVSRGDTPTGRAALATFTNPTSVPAALQADRTLGGACRTLIVERLRGSGRLYTIGGTDYLGAMFDVRVWSTP